MKTAKTVKTVKDVFEEFEADKNAGFEVKMGRGQVALVLHYAGEKRVLMECDPANAFYSMDYEKDKSFLVRLSEVSKVKVGRVWMDTTKAKAEEDPEFANVPANWAENLPERA